MQLIENRNRSPEKGFTLIEMSIVILIIGLAIGVLSPLYTAHLKKQKIETTQTNIELATDAIANFRTLYGRYPCPASLTSVRGEAQYGRENCDDFSATAPGSGITNGIYIQQATRLTNHSFTDPFTGPTVGQPRVRIGFVPFRQLELNEDQAYDGYNNRIAYAVTEHLAFSNTFQIDGGGIEIINVKDNAFDAAESALGNDTQKSTAHFLLISFGESEAGAYTREGQLIECVSNLEKENCNFTSSGNPNASFLIGQTGQSENTASFFDDTLNYFTQEDIPFWQRSETTGDLGNIHSKATGNVALNTNQFTNIVQKAEIDGTLRVQDDPETTSIIEGKIGAQRFCDVDGQNCFPISAIAGRLDDDPLTQENEATGGLQCPDDDPDGVGKFIIGIANGQLICEDEIIIQCPAGQFLKGISANGNPICADSSGMPTCPDGEVEISTDTDGNPICVEINNDTNENCSSTTIFICGETRFLNGASGGASASFSGGYSRIQNYACNEGTWSLTNATGRCNLCTWTTIGATSQGIQNTFPPGAAEIGQECSTCGENSHTCYDPLTSGEYEIYLGCYCGFE